MHHERKESTREKYDTSARAMMHILHTYCTTAGRQLYRVDYM
jgi:hypothetical protein